MARISSSSCAFCPGAVSWLSAKFGTWRLRSWPSPVFGSGAVSGLNTSFESAEYNFVEGKPVVPSMWFAAPRPYVLCNVGVFVMFLGAATGGMVEIAAAMLTAAMFGLTSGWLLVASARFAQLAALQCVLVDPYIVPKVGMPFVGFRGESAFSLFSWSFVDAAMRVLRFQSLVFAAMLVAFLVSIVLFVKLVLFYFPGVYGSGKGKRSGKGESF